MADPPDQHISAAVAIVLSVLFTCTFVGVLYLHPLTRPSPLQSRDAPSVIRLRIRAIHTSCVLTSFAVLAALRLIAGRSLPAILHLLGIWPASPIDVAKTLALTMLLFAGPLAAHLWLDRDPRDDLLFDARAALGSWIGWRNYVVGPATEELTFRSHILALHLAMAPSTATPTVLTLCTPLYFGIAHLHHLYEFRLTHPSAPLHLAVVRSLVQFAYTTLFGWYAAFIYLRFGSLWAAIAAHSFCNVMGLPRFWGVLDAEPHGRATWRTWTYYLLLAVGALGFYTCLWSWTGSRNALVQYT